MKYSQTAFYIASILFSASLAMAADAPPPAPATQPDPAADRLTFLTLQLSSIEASLNAVNSALRIAGYKSVASSGNAQYYAHNNTELDRNGGGPISWDKFYGKTAKEFAPRDIYGVPHNYQRPDQFDYMYKANNDQITKANADVSNLSKKIDDLLTRRRQLDSEQSALWATISWESVQNHDIPLNPLYRFQLKATASTPASDARRDVLRPAILFLRTIDKTVADDLDSLSTNQEATLADLKDRTQSAYSAAKEPFANAMLSADMSPEDLKTSKDLLAVMKRLPELAKNITESYHLALDGDTAHDDNRKLTFRAQLQSALLDYAAATADLDYQLNTLSKSWGLEPQKGVATSDQIPNATTKITAAPPSPISPPADNSQTPSSSSSEVKNSSTQSPTGSGRSINLLKLIDPAKNTISGMWEIHDGQLESAARGASHLEIPYVPPAEYDCTMVFTRKLGTAAISLITSENGHDFAWNMSQANNHWYAITDFIPNAPNPTATMADKLIVNNQQYVCILKVRKDHLEVYLNDKLLVQLNTDYTNLHTTKDYVQPNHTMGLFINVCDVVIKKLEVVEISGEGKLIR